MTENTDPTDDTLLVRYSHEGEAFTIEIPLVETAALLRMPGSDHPLDIRVVTQALAQQRAWARQGKSVFCVYRTTEGRTVVIPPEKVISIEGAPGNVTDQTVTCTLCKQPKPGTRMRRDPFTWDRDNQSWYTAMCDSCEHDRMRDV